MSGFDLLGALALGYLLGGFPSAALAARMRGQRIFEVGSGNMGAMNTARNLGFALGLGVLAADIAKGALAAYGALLMGSALGATREAGTVLAAAAGVAAVAGHAWSPFVGFRGGKSLATAFGASLPVYPWGGLAGLTMIVALVLIFRRAEPATWVTLVCYPALAYFATLRAGGDQALAFTAATATALIAVLVALKFLALWLGRRRTEQDPASS